MKYVMTILLLMLACASPCYAGIVITEIMYDPAGTDTNREWIEVYNNGSTDIPFSTWKLYESGVNHGLVAAGSTDVLPAGGYTVIVQNPVGFVGDFPDPDIAVFDSAFSLVNTTESLEIRDDSLITVDTVTYNSEVGAANDGNSLQLISGQWVAAAPTPGAENSASSTGSGSTDSAGGDSQLSNTGTNSGSGSTSNSNTGGSSSNSSNTSNNSSTTTSSSSTNSNTSKSSSTTKSTTTQTKFIDPYYQFTITLDTAKPIAGNSVAIDTVLRYITTSSTQTVHYGIFTIQYGDGVSESTRKLFTLHHTWDEPGTYNMVISYKTSKLKLRPDITISKKVEVLAPTVTIGQSESGRVVITNSGSGDIGIGEWIIASGHNQYTLPVGTTVFGHSRMTVSDQVIAPQAGQRLILYTNTGIEVADDRGSGELGDGSTVGGDEPSGSSPQYTAPASDTPADLDIRADTTSESITATSSSMTTSRRYYPGLITLGIIALMVLVAYMTIGLPISYESTQQVMDTESEESEESDDSETDLEYDTDTHTIKNRHNMVDGDSEVEYILE